MVVLRYQWRRTEDVLQLGNAEACDSTSLEIHSWRMSDVGVQFWTHHLPFAANNSVVASCCTYDSPWVPSQLGVVRRE